MPAVIRLTPPNGVQTRGKILFAARMMRPQGFSQPVNSLAYLAPPLLKAGYEVLVSEAATFPANSVFAEPAELFWARKILREEIAEIQPDFVAFPVYDSNAALVHSISSLMENGPNSFALVFGSYFISINPEESLDIFGKFPNVVMINGEAENALPKALNTFKTGEQTDSAGIFVRKEGDLLGTNFMTRVALSQAEHEALEVNFDVFESVHKPLFGLEVTTSRGCFEGCTFCASSNSFRKRHVTWSAEKKIEVLRQALQWLKKRNGNLSIGFPDDSFFYNLREGMEFLRALRADPIVDEIELVPQISLGTLFRKGKFVEEAANLMLRPDGSPFVRCVTLGLDFWSKPERQRNKGGREGRLTEQQIRQGIKAFRDKEIFVHAYWLLGDEKSTMSSFANGMLFLAELILDHGPYFAVDAPEPVELRTGTPIRERVLAAKNLPPGYINAVDEIEAGGRKVLFYDPILPRPELVATIFQIFCEMKAAVGQEPHMTPEVFLKFISGIVGKWREEVMSPRENKIVGHYLKLRRKGKSRQQLMQRMPDLNYLPFAFLFFDRLMEFSIEEWLELAEIDSRIPDYFTMRGDLHAERLRRNPDFMQQLAKRQAAKV